MPDQMFSLRWRNMDLVDITGWASGEIKKVYISQIYLDAPHVAYVREFIPIEGDMLEEQWINSAGVPVSHPVPRYALADIRQAADIMKDFIDANIGMYILGTVGKLDPLLWGTYYFAFCYQPNAKVC